MPLILSIVLFGVFAVNVGMGASTGSTFLSDVGELLVLGAAAISFVVAILKREAAAKKASGKQESMGG